MAIPYLRCTTRLPNAAAINKSVAAANQLSAKAEPQAKALFTTTTITPRNMIVHATMIAITNGVTGRPL